MVPSVRTLEQIIREHLGNLLMQIAILQAEKEELLTKIPKSKKVKVTDATR